MSKFDIGYVVLIFKESALNPKTRLSMRMRVPRRNPKAVIGENIDNLQRNTRVGIKRIRTKTA